MDTTSVNPWGKQYLDVDPNSFKYENNQWWDMRGSTPQSYWALNQSHPSGWLDPGNAQTRPWWSYAEMNPGMADMYRNQYGNATQMPAGAVHPGTYAQGQTPQGMLRNWVNPQNTGVGIGNFLPGFDPARMGNQGAYSSFIQQAGYDPVTGYKSGFGPQTSAQPNIGAPPTAPGQQPQLNAAPNAPGTQPQLNSAPTAPQGNMGGYYPMPGTSMPSGRWGSVSDVGFGGPPPDARRPGEPGYGDPRYDPGARNYQAYSNPGYWNQYGNMFRNPTFLQALIYLLSRGGM